MTQICKTRHYSRRMRISDTVPVTVSMQEVPVQETQEEKGSEAEGTDWFVGGQGSGE